nr:hypothetical protein [Tanacetum cinerariifolium]
MHKAFLLLGESSHWQYKFPLPVNVVPTAIRLEMPLPGVCTAIEEMKKLPAITYYRKYLSRRPAKRPTTNKAKFVKAAERPTTDKVETAKKPTVRYAEMYRRTSKRSYGAPMRPSHGPAGHRLHGPPMNFPPVNRKLPTGTDNRPPMLVESDYESWKIRIERYIRGKPLGKLIWRSIQNGPTPHPQITVTEGQGAAAVQVTRDKMDEEFIEIENNKELADIQATNILSQGLPRRVFNILNQTHTGKEIWDNVELLMKVYRHPHLHSLYPPQLVAQSSNDATLATMNQIVNLLSGFQKQFPPTNNQLKTSSNSRSHATVHDVQIVTETVQRKASGNVGNTDKMLLMEAKEKEAVLDAEVEAFLADVEYEGPHAAVAFMANLSSTSGTNGATISHFNKVHTDDNQIFDNVIHLLAHEMHKEEHLDSDVESDINDNTIPYHQYQLDSEVQDVPTEEQSMVNDSLRAELARYENLVKEVTEFMQIFDELDKEYEQCVLEKKKFQIEKKNLLIQNGCLITDCIAKDICCIMLSSDRDRPLSEELRLNCVRENSKVIELEAEILKQQQMLVESDK